GPGTGENSVLGKLPRGERSDRQADHADNGTAQNAEWRGMREPQNDGRNEVTRSDSPSNEEAAGAAQSGAPKRRRTASNTSSTLMASMEGSVSLIRLWFPVAPPP